MKETRIPVTFEYSASHYCKACNTWGDSESSLLPCGGCGQKGYLIDNPFPGNLIPYVVIYPNIVGDKLDASKEPTDV